MKRMGASNVLIVGMKGLGAEIGMIVFRPRLKMFLMSLN
jgi:hypothetical protein